MSVFPLLLRVNLKKLERDMASSSRNLDGTCGLAYLIKEASELELRALALLMEIHEKPLRVAGFLERRGLGGGMCGTDADWRSR